MTASQQLLASENVMKTLDEKKLIAHIESRIKEFSGAAPELESAIGAFFVGKQTGWKILLLIHDRRTIAKYEKFLDLNFKDHMEPEGPMAMKSLAWRLIKKDKDFWKAVRGEIPDVRTPEVVRGLT